MQSAARLRIFKFLAVVLPLIGHATWHAYRETVETEHARSA